MGDEIYISREMKTPGMLDIELLKCVWDSIFSCTLTHIILKTTFFVFVKFPDKATFRTCLGKFRYSILQCSVYFKLVHPYKTKYVTDIK